MTLDQLRTLCALARLKSFSLAAEELCLSQPAVSVQIRELERECGARLFDRLGRRVALTQAGEILLACAEDVLHRLDAAKQELDDLQGLRRGRLSIGAAQVVGIYVLPDFLRRFKERYPDIEIALQMGYGQDVVERLINGSMDFALVGETRSALDFRLERRDFYIDELAVVTAGSHPWADRSAVDVTELASQPFVISRRSSSVWQLLRSRFDAAGLGIKPSMEFGSSDGVKRAVEVGLGVSILPRVGVSEDEIRLGRLKALRVRGIPTEFRMLLLWRKDRHLPVVARAFLSFLDLESPGGLPAEQDPAKGSPAPRL